MAVSSGWGNFKKNVCVRTKQAVCNKEMVSIIMYSGHQQNKVQQNGHQCNLVQSLTQ